MIYQVEPDIDKIDQNYINSYMQSGGWITEGKVTKEFEKAIAETVNRKFAIGVPNGTIAIYLALLANGIEKGSLVAVPNITMVATINAIIWAGATPVLIDTDERLCMSLEHLQKIKNLDCIVYVPLNGRTSNGKEIFEYAKREKIVLIEDSAHALGSNYKNIACGSLGNTSVLSFTPHKIITTGQGGMVLTDNKRVYEKVMDLKTFNRSKDKSDIHKGFGLNFKITDLQSTLGLSQLSKLDKYIEHKKKLFLTYSNYQNQNYRFINFNSYETPWFMDIVFKSKKIRNEVHSLLRKINIETRFAYPPLSSQKMFKNLRKTNLSNSENIANNILWMPSSNNLSISSVKLIMREISNLLK